MSSLTVITGVLSGPLIDALTFDDSDASVVILVIVWQESMLIINSRIGWKRTVTIRRQMYCKSVNGQVKEN